GCRDRFGRRRRNFRPVAGSRRHFEDGSTPHVLDQPFTQPQKVILPLGNFVKPVILGSALTIILLHCIFQHHGSQRPATPLSAWLRASVAASLRRDKQAGSITDEILILVEEIVACEGTKKVRFDTEVLDLVTVLRANSHRSPERDA